MATDKTQGERFVVKLPSELKKQVFQIAKGEDVSASQLTRRALKRYVEQSGKAAS